MVKWNDNWRNKCTPTDMPDFTDREEYRKTTGKHRRGKTRGRTGEEKKRKNKSMTAFLESSCVRGG